MNPFEHHWAVVIECHTLLQAHEIPEELIVKRKGITGATQYVAGDVSPSLLEAFAEENFPRVEIIRPQEKIPDAVTMEDLVLSKNTNELKTHAPGRLSSCQ